MKRIYKRIEVASSEILLTLALFSDVGGAESVDAADLDRLEAQLSRPNYTGAEQLPVANVQRSHLEITNEGEVLAVLHRLKRGENIFVCKARYGTNISVQLTIDFVVTDPNETTPVEISEDVVLVESIGDGGGGGGEFPTDYAKQGTDPNATLTDTQAYAQSAASDAGAAKTAAEAAKDAAQAIAIPSDYSKQGADPTATNTAILEVVQSIANIESDVQAGRQALAANITAKGVPTSVSDALVTMAAKVLQIPQQLNTRTSEFEQMIAPTPYMWNVYSVATDLIKQELPAYIPSYMAGGNYAQYRANNAFFVGEYYLGYATLELAGAEGYLTCDGHFYTINGEVGSRVVTHTLPDGTVETYAAESIIHTWTDGESGYYNRWIGFFYLTNAYSFSNINANICPRRVAICGECLSFIVSGANRLTDVWVIGTLEHFEGGTSSSWGNQQVVQNYKVHSSGTFYYNSGGFSMLCMPDLEEISGGQILYGNNTGASGGLITTFPKLRRISSGAKIFNATASESYNYVMGSVQLLYLESLKTCYGSVLYLTQGGPYSSVCTNLKEIVCPELEDAGSAFVYLSFSNVSTTKMINLERVYMPKLTAMSGHLININLISAYGGNTPLQNLIDVTVGEMTTNIQLHEWNPVVVLADADKKAQLIDNIKNHILANVSDRTGLTRLTFTVSTTMYNAIASENITWQEQTMTLADAFLTKNWLLAGA